MAELINEVLAACADPKHRLSSYDKELAPPTMLGPLRRNLMDAEVFRLDDALAYRASILGRETTPTQFLSFLPLAKPPAPYVWFEWDDEVRLKAVGHEFKQKTAGFLVKENEEEGRLYVGSYALDDLGVIIPPTLLVIDRIKPTVIQPAPSEKMLRATASIMLGVGYWDKHKDEPNASRLASHIYGIAGVGPGALQIKSLPQLKDEIRAKLLSHVAGDFQFLMAILKLLASKYTVIGEPSAPKPVRMIYGGHKVPWLQSKTLTITLPATKPFHWNEPGERVGESRRMHSYIGHWCERRKSGRSSCQHTWEPEGADPNHLHCTTCGRKRWWRKGGNRGDASKGVVQKDYLLMANLNRT